MRCQFHCAAAFEQLRQTLLTLPIMPIPMLDLQAQHAQIRDEIVRAMMQVVDAQLFILGAPVERLEEQVAGLSKTKYAIGWWAIRQGSGRVRPRACSPTGRSITSPWS